MVKILTDLQFQMEGDEIIVPSFRSDVEHKADIAEEIARFYGYNSVPNHHRKGKPGGWLQPTSTRNLKEWSTRICWHRECMKS